MKRFGLIGYPLSHSFSKKYFTDKFAAEGITGCEYEVYPLPDITQFPQLVRDHPELAGLNVTIPYKQQVLPYLTDTSSLPAGVDACNCIRITEGRLEAYNTDIIGFQESFAPLLRPHHTRALVLGNGGATLAVLAALRNLGISYSVVSRQLHQGSTMTYEQVDAAIIRDHTIIVNTTPLGTFPDVDAYAPIPYEHIGSDHYLFDLVYNPAVTKFLAEGMRRGAITRNGYDMLAIQAEASWKIWNGL